LVKGINKMAYARTLGMVDTNGDGIADALGYDTKGDGCALHHHDIIMTSS
jgi:hypothetical protein